MDVIKVCGKVIGAKLTVAERRAIEIEAKKIVAEEEKKFAREMDAIILYHIRQQTGYGATRLQRFFKGFVQDHQNLIEQYQLDVHDTAWYAEEQLKKIGVDLDKLYDDVK